MNILQKILKYTSEPHNYYYSIEKFSERIATKFVSIFLSKPQMEPLTKTNLQGISLINITKDRHAYTKKHKMFRFFYYESVRYCSIEPAYIISYIRKIDPNKYIRNFEELNSTNYATSITLDKITSHSSYKHLHQTLNSHQIIPSHNIFKRLRVGNSFIFNKLALLITKIPLIKKIYGIPKFWYTEKIPIETIIAAIGNKKTTSNRSTLYTSCIAVLHKIKAKYSKKLAFILAFKNNTVKYLRIKLILVLASNKLKDIITNKIKCYEPKQYNIKYLLFKQFYNIVYGAPHEHNELQTGLAGATNENTKVAQILDMALFTNRNYKLLLDAQLSNYLDYFYICSEQLYIQRKLYEVLPPVNTYRIFSICVLISFNKYYLNIYTGKCIELKANILPHDTNKNNNSVYYYFNKFHYLLQKKEYCYLKEYTSKNKLLFSFLANNFRMLDYSSGIHKVSNLNNFYYPITLQKYLVSRRKNIINKENKLFSDSFTLSEIVRTEYGFDKAVTSYKSIHKHYRTKMFSIKNTLYISDNKTLAELSGGINSPDMKKVLVGSKLRARMLYANTFNNRIIEKIHDHYRIRPDIEQSNINIANKLVHDLSLKKKIVNNRKRSVARYHINDLDKRLYIYIVYNKLLNKKDNSSNINVQNNINLVNRLIITKILIPVTLYTTNIQLVQLNEINTCQLQSLLALTDKLKKYLSNLVSNNHIRNANTINKCIHGILYTIRNIYKLIRLLQNVQKVPAKYNIAYDILLILEILTRLQSEPLATTYKNINFNWIFASTQLHNQINKIKFFRKKTLQNIKYLKYGTMSNELTIYYMNEGSIMFDAAKSIFYSKSKNINSKYNELTKTNNLLFSKLVTRLRGKYSINRWLSFKDLVIDLVANYRTIHKDPTIHEYQDEQKTTIVQDWQTIANYLSEGHYPYSRNLLKTTTWHSEIHFINDWLNTGFSTSTERDMLWNTVKLQNKRFEIEWLFPYNGAFGGGPLESVQFIQRPEYINPRIQKNVVDVLAKDIVLWNIPSSAMHSMYEPSYFTNKLYYLDYLDYIIYKYIISDISIDNKTRKAMSAKSFPIVHDFDNDILSKFSWDINSYDLKYIIPLYGPSYKYISYGVNKIKRKIFPTNRNETSLHDYIVSNITGSKMDPTPFQFTTLRWMIASNKKTLRAEQQNNNIFEKLRYKLNARIETTSKDSKDHVLPLLQNIMHTTVHSTKRTLRQPLLITNKIKSISKPGLYDLNILPNYLQSQIDKEIYLYRQKISELLEFEEVERIHVVESSRLINSIVNTSLLVSSHELLYNCINSQETNYLEMIKLYQRNIQYYSQIILQYNIFVLEKTSRFLHSAINSGYEWDHLTSELYRARKIDANQQPLVNDYFTIYSDPKRDKPYKYTLYTKIPFGEDYTYNVSVISEIVNWCNTQIFDIIYTNNHHKVGIDQLSVQSMYKIQLLLEEYRKKINIYFKAQSNRMKKINSILLKLKLKPEQYLKFSFKLLQCSIIQISEKHFTQVPLSFMLLYISGLPIIKKFYDYIQNNLIKNIDLASIPYLYRHKYNKYDSNIFKHAMYKLGTYIETKSWLTANTYDQFMESYFKRRNANEEAYFQLFNLYFERRFIWYITKSMYLNTTLTNTSLDKYKVIYRSLFTKNKLTNTKLSLNSLEKITQHFTSIDRYSTIVGNVPVLYSALYNSIIKQLYTQSEPILSGYRTSIARYYKPIPFELGGTNQEPFLIYIGLKALYKWKTYIHYLTYPIKVQNQNLCQFIRYKLYDINLNTRKQRLLSRYGAFITELTLMHINYLKKYRVKTTKYMFSKLEKTPFTSIYNKMHNIGRLEIYFAFIKHHTGVLYYLPNLLINSTDRASITQILDIPQYELAYLQYFGHYFLNNENTVFICDDIYYTMESDAESYFLIGLKFDENMLGRADIIVHYWDNGVELENAMLLSYLNSLFINTSKINKSRYTIKSNSNIHPLINILLGDPANILLFIFIFLLMDTDSNSLLLFNLNKHPTSQDNWRWIFKLPLLSLDGEEEEGDIGLIFDEYSSQYFRLLSNPREYSEYDESDYINNSRNGIGNVHRSVFLQETEPLAPLGIEIDISPLFRIFTYSGIRIWNEKLKALLLLQQNSFWSINYIADTQAFSNIFTNNAEIGMNPSTITGIKDSFKNFNFPEEAIPAYIQKYHRANNISDFKKWLEMYFYGLLEYQRTVPDSYDKLFSQPSVKAFLYYNFINDKEYELANKRSLRHLAGRLYSLQRDPAQQEEFFLYPNKRVQPVQLTQRRRALKYYDFSVPKNKYSYPRTGYESYPYSYAQNMWYFHHALVNNPRIYMKLYRNHLAYFEEEEATIDYYIRAKHYLQQHIQEILYKYILHYKKRKRRQWVTTVFPLWHKLYSKTYKRHYAEMSFMYKYGIRFRLNRFFTTNTIKLNDLNLLYKPLKQPTGAHNIVSYSLHPKIRNKYSLKVPGSHNITTKIQMFPKQKVTSMKMFLHHQVNANLAWRILSKHSFAIPDIAKTIYAYRGISKSVLTSNALFHERPYGVLWSIYNRTLVNIDLARNAASLGLIGDMLSFGFNSLRGQNRTGVHAVSDLETDCKQTEQHYRYGASIPTVNETQLVEFNNRAYYLGQSGLAGYTNDFIDLNGELHSDPEYKGYKAGWYIMPALHGLYIPQSSFSLRNFSSYIPMQFSLNTKDLLNSNYLTTQDWYNPSFYALFVTRHFDNGRYGRRFWYFLHSHKGKRSVEFRRITSRVLSDNIAHTYLNNQDDLTGNFFDRWQNQAMVQLNNKEWTFGKLFKQTTNWEKFVLNAGWYSILSVDGDQPIVIRQINKYLTGFMDYISAFSWNTTVQKKNNLVNPYDSFNSKRVESVRTSFLEYVNFIADMDRMDAVEHRTARTTPKFGVYKRMDFTNPILRAFMPNKVRDQATSDINTANIYINRNHFVNIYEHFRIKPFLYKHREPSRNMGSEYLYLYPIFNKVTSIYNIILNITNKALYPLESQWSSSRKTSDLVVLDFNSTRRVLNHNQLRILTEPMKRQRFENMWAMKYGRYYLRHLKFGIKPKKSNVYSLANIVKVKYYNMLRQATYYRPTKNFFPTARLSSYSRILNLKKGETQLQKRLHKDSFMHNENFYRYKNFPKELIEAYLRAAFPPRKKRIRPRLRKKGKYIYARFVDEAITVMPHKVTLPLNFPHEWLKRGVRRYQTHNLHTLSQLRFNDRYISARVRMRVLLGAFRMHVIHRYGTPHRTVNLGRNVLNLITNQYANLYPFDIRIINKKMEKRIREWQKDHLAREDIPIILKNFPTSMHDKMESILVRKCNYKPFVKYYKPLQNVTAWNADWYLGDRRELEIGLTDQTGRVFEKLSKPSDKELAAHKKVKVSPQYLYENMQNKPSNFSYKNIDKIKSDTMYVFGNINYNSGTIPARRLINFGYLSKDLIVPFIKPKKYSKYMPKLKEIAISLLRHKANRFAHNKYNSAFVQSLKKMGRVDGDLHRYLHGRKLLFLRGRMYEDKLPIYSKDALPRAKKEFNRGTHSVIHRDSYWQYKASKQLEHSSKFKTSDFFTTRVDSGKIFEHYSEDIERTTRPSTHDFAQIRGTLLDRQFIYNYNVQSAKYNLPLVEYFYYTQFSKDNTNILSIHNFHVLHKDTPTLLEDQIIRISPFIQKDKGTTINYTNLINTNDTHLDKIERILVENSDFSNLVDAYQYNIIACDKDTFYDSYIFVNSFTRPIVHWFVKIYYNNIHYFDAFYSWCCDNLSNIIIF